MKTGSHRAREQVEGQVGWFIVGRCPWQARLPAWLQRAPDTKASVRLPDTTSYEFRFEDAPPPRPPRSQHCPLSRTRSFIPLLTSPDHLGLQRLHIPLKLQFQ